MNPKVVFFGEADYGKSTIIGYLYSYAYNVDLNRVEGEIKKRLGANYRNDIIYSYLINPDVWGSKTTQTVETRDLSDGGYYEEGIKIVKDTDTETIIQSTTVIGSKVRIITQKNRKDVFERLNSQTHHLKNIVLPWKGREISFMLVDTPGHATFLSERELGISLGDIGVFCISINEILRDDFEEMMLAFSDLWSEYNYNKKLIYALTKFDLPGFEYSQEAYDLACERIKKYCKRVTADCGDTAFGMSFSFEIDEEDAAAIIPVAVDFNERKGINIIERSDRTPWYTGPTLLEAIVDRMDEMETAYRENVPQNLIFSIDKNISNTKNKTGKVWRIKIKNGTIHVGDSIILTSARLNGFDKEERYDVTAEVKSIHREMDAIEGEKTVESAGAGEIVTIDLKNCAVGRKRINKSDIKKTTRLTTGFAAGEKYVKIDEFDLDLKNNTSALEHIKTGQNIVLLWFGRRVSAKVMDISEKDLTLHVKVQYGMKLDIPENPALLRLDDFYSLKFFSESEGKLWYYSGAVKLN